MTEDVPCPPPYALVPRRPRPRGRARGARCPRRPRRSGGGAHEHHGKHEGHHTEDFRRRFWVSLVLTVPLVVTSHMVMDWFGYELELPAGLVAPSPGRSSTSGRADPSSSAGLRDHANRG